MSKMTTQMLNDLDLVDEISGQVEEALTDSDGSVRKILTAIGCIKPGCQIKKTTITDLKAQATVIEGALLAIKILAWRAKDQLDIDMGASEPDASRRP